MASCQPSAQSEGQSPQPSTSGYAPEAVVDEESPGPSGEEAGGRRDLTGLTSEYKWVQKPGRCV